MGDVYRNSFITLAAVGAPDSSDGLFAQRDPLMFVTCQLAQTEASCMEVCPAITKSSGDEFFSWPLHKRGWVVQKRILPLRTLNFGSFIWWECRERYMHEFYDCGNISSRTSWKDVPLCGKFFNRILKGKSLLTEI
jgi:hypothetical protein